MEQSRVERADSGTYLKQERLEILTLLSHLYHLGSSAGLIIMCQNIISNQLDFGYVGWLGSERWWVFNSTVGINVYFAHMRDLEWVLEKGKRYRFIRMIPQKVLLQ